MTRRDRWRGLFSAFHYIGPYGDHFSAVVHVPDVERPRIQRPLSRSRLWHHGLDARALRLVPTARLNTNNGMDLIRPRAVDLASFSICSSSLW